MIRGFPESAIKNRPKIVNPAAGTGAGAPEMSGKQGKIVEEGRE
jgi:hypothetical protein